MKKNQKIFTTMLFVCVACFLIGIMGIFSAQSVKADSITSLKIGDGAEVRMAYDEDDSNNYAESGLRYNISISADDYDAVKGSAKFGILIAPYDYHKDNALNKANVFGIGGEAVYGWAEKNADGSWNEYDGDLTEIINLSTTDMTYDKDENVYRFYGSIVDIKEENRGREFIGVGYVQYSDDVVMVEGDARSMAYVAQMAHADEENDLTDADRTFLYDNYMKGIESSATVNHYQMKADGTYDLIEEAAGTTDTIQIGDKISADENTYEGYVLNEAISNAEDVMYANGKTALNFYYYQENLGLVDNSNGATFDYQTAFPNATSYVLNKVIWDDEAHENQTENYDGYWIPAEGGIAEKKVAVTLSNYVTDGKLDFAKLDGVYEIQATYGSGENEVAVGVKFDSYDATSTDYVWNNASIANDYTRVYAWNGGAKDVGGQKEIVTLTDEGHTGDYIKMDYIGTGTLTHPSIGGFSVLSVHSYEYYVEALKNDPTLQLSFNFKVKGVSLDGETIVGLHGSANDRGRVYVNGTEQVIGKDSEGNTTYNIDESYRYPGEIMPDTWYSVKIPLETLLKSWDVMRYKSNDSITNTNYGRYMNKLIFWNTQSVDSQGNAFDYAANLASFDIWVGDFGLQGVDFNNLASEASQYNFHLSGAAKLFANYNGGDGILSFKNANVVPISAQYDGTEASINGVTNVKNFVFTVPSEQTQMNRHIMMAVDLSFLTKDTLTKLDNAGYKKLTYAVVVDAYSIAGATSQVRLCKINFDAFRDGDGNVVDTYNGVFSTAASTFATYIDRRVFTDDTVLGTHPTEWQTIEYSIKDLIDCYDKVFIGQYFILGIPWAYYIQPNTKGPDGTNAPSIYLSPIKLVK